MKQKAILLGAAILAMTLHVGQPAAHAGGSATFGVFYNGLAPHGEWITVDAGVFAWRPLRTEAGWRPYLNGRWAWTDDGWYWDSDEPWGWATYHYGRWYYDDYYGWLWVPGYDWSPAWVEWRYGGEYVGWAPLGPYACFNANWGIYYNRHWVTPYHYWSFVDCRYMTNSGVHRYVYRTENNARFIGRTRTAGNVRFDNGRIVTRGPDPRYIERRGNVRVERSELSDVSSRDDARVVRSGERERIGVYRPRIDERVGDRHADRPPDVRDRERVPSLDTRDIDARRRDVGRESGRDVSRSDDLQPMRPGDPNVNARDDRFLDRGRSDERPARTIDPAPRDDQRRAPAERSPQIERRTERTPEIRGDNGRNMRERNDARPRSEQPRMASPSGNRQSRPEGRAEGRSAPSSRGGGRRGR